MRTSRIPVQNTKGVVADAQCGQGSAARNTIVRRRFSRGSKLVRTRSKLVQLGPSLFGHARQLRVGFVHSLQSPGSRLLDEPMQLPETLG